MAEKTFNQEYEGYWIESGLSTLSTKPGVYGVYKCTYNKEKDSVSLKELIYIGKADNLNSRINNHEDWDIWRNELQAGEQICFCYTFVDKSNNERVEATLINSNQPKLNIEYKDYFPFDRTIVICSGEHIFIKETNIVDRN